MTQVLNANEKPVKIFITKTYLDFFDCLCVAIASTIRCVSLSRFRNMKKSLKEKD